MLDLRRLDLDTIAEALADQGDYFEHRLAEHPASGGLMLWTSDTGLDGQYPIELDDVDDSLVAISPLPPSVWYRDMVEFAEAVSDETARERLLRALQGRGPFRRFKNELYQRWPDLISAWHVFRAHGANAEHSSGWSKTDSSTATRPRTSCRGDPSVVRPEPLELTRVSVVRCQGGWLPSFVTVGAGWQEGSEWARFDSQRHATPLWRLQCLRTASPQVRGRFRLLRAADRKGSRSRSVPSVSSR